MTPEEWLGCTNPQLLLGFANGKVSPRKFRLLACAFCHRVYHLLPDEFRKVLELGERAAEGLVGPRKLIEMRTQLALHPPNVSNAATGAAKATIEAIPLEAATPGSTSACSAMGDAAVRAGLVRRGRGTGGPRGSTRRPW